MERWQGEGEVEEVELEVERCGSGDVVGRITVRDIKSDNCLFFFFFMLLM